jgi:hypothetical protein
LRSSEACDTFRVMMAVADGGVTSAHFSQAI